MSDATTIRFTLNEAPMELEVDDPKRPVLSLLREELGVTSIKPGCSPQGICGCCVALIDGRPRITCTLPVKTLEGKTVVTHEGLDERTQKVLAESFVSKGGTQCGYCTPGIAMQCTALLEKNPDPSKDEIDRALNMHICRCTGWVKIHDAVHDAADRLREVRTDAPADDGVGSSWRQDDLREAVMGRRPYIEDMHRPGLLYGALVWAPHARCRIDRIDLSAAEKVAGFVEAATAADISGNRKVGLIFRDWPVLIAEGEETRCCADIVAIVVADSALAAKEARDAVVVHAERLDPVTDMVEAAKDPNNVLATSVVRKGQGGAALASCAHVVEETFVTQVIDQAFLEPEASLVVPLGDDKYRIYSQGQGVFDDQKQLCELFDMTPEQVQVELVPTGGGFGAKEDLNVQPHALLMARKTGRPVRICLDMQESTRFHPKRHALRMAYSVGCDAKGNLQVVKARILGDTGGYASVGDKVLERAAGHACGPYRVPNVDVEAKTIYTNNPVCGAMRGFGVNQVAFALEGCLDRLAEQLGVDALDFRAKNLLRPGDRFATGQVMNDGCAIFETLEALRPHYDRARALGKHVGVACGIKNVGMGNGLREVGRVELVVESDVEITLYTGFTEMGQGHDSVMRQMAAEATGLPAEIFHVICATDVAVETGMTTASRATYLGGNAILAMAPAFNRALSEVEGVLAKLQGQRFVGEWTAPDTHKPEDVTDTPVTHYAFGFGSQLAIVDAEGHLEEVVAAHDVGRAINRVSCEGQVEGGVHMGIGYALSEELAIGPDAMPDLRYRALGVIKAKHMPKVTTLLLEHPDPNGPWGAKGIGEIGLVPTAPAIAAAIHSFDGVWRTQLPMKDTEAARAVGVRVKKSG